MRKISPKRVTPKAIIQSLESILGYYLPRTEESICYRLNFSGYGVYNKDKKCTDRIHKHLIDLRKKGILQIRIGKDKIKYYEITQKYALENNLKFFRVSS